jgi:hypothetical protein
MLALDEMEARRAREFFKFAQIQRDRNKIELALSKLVPTPVSVEASVDIAVSDSVNRVDEGDNFTKKPSAATTAPSASAAKPKNGGIVSSISSFFSSPYPSMTVNSTVKMTMTDTVTTTTTADNEIMMTTLNPMANNGRAASPNVADSIVGNDAKVIQIRIATLLKDLSKAGPLDNKEYHAYLRTVSLSLPPAVNSNDSTQVRSLEKIEIALRRLQLALQLRSVIEKVSLHTDDLQEQWFESMMKIPNLIELKNQMKQRSSDNEYLKQVDESLRQYRSLRCKTCQGNICKSQRSRESLLSELRSRSQFDSKDLFRSFICSILHCEDVCLRIG